MAVAKQINNPLSDELLAAGRNAFVHALHATAAISAVVVLATAVLAWVLLRRVAIGSEH